MFLLKVSNKDSLLNYDDDLGLVRQIDATSDNLRPNKFFIARGW